MTQSQQALKLHKKLRGKIEIKPKIKIRSKKDLSLVYTPHVASISEKIAQDCRQVFDYTNRGNTVAIVTDGSAVLGLGNVGPEASLPVMEGKAMLFKQYAGIDAYPICLSTQDTKEIISIIKNIVPSFGGINLEDISAPRCFEIEKKLQDIGIPVMHNDQHGTAIVVLAALINAAKLVNKTFADLKVVINGAGAAGTAIAKLLCNKGKNGTKITRSVADILVLDSQGIIDRKRRNLNKYKKELAKITNKKNVSGGLARALKGADVFIGVSVGNIVNKMMIQSMNKNSIVFALANPIPEIMPDKARQAGAVIVATGRSDFANQINNALAFPGIFLGAMDIKAPSITLRMKLTTAEALAAKVKNPQRNRLLPSVIDKSVAFYIAKSIKNSYNRK